MEGLEKVRSKLSTLRPGIRKLRSRWPLSSLQNQRPVGLLGSIGSPPKEKVISGSEWLAWSHALGTLCAGQVIATLRGSPPSVFPVSLRLSRNRALVPTEPQLGWLPNVWWIQPLPTGCFLLMQRFFSCWAVGAGKPQKNQMVPDAGMHKHRPAYSGCSVSTIGDTSLVNLAGVIRWSIRRTWGNSNNRGLTNLVMSS